MISLDYIPWLMIVGALLAVFITICIMNDAHSAVIPTDDKNVMKQVKINERFVLIYILIWIILFGIGTALVQHLSFH